MKESAKRKLLITGASGFVGSHMVQYAQEHDYAVVAPSHAELPLGNREFVISFLREIQPYAVIHLATSSLMSGKTADPHTLLETNVEGTVNLMDAAQLANVQAFINMGSFVECGPKTELLREDMLCAPVELYAVSKLAASLYGQGLARRTGFSCITFRLFTPYGPGIQPGRLARVVIEKINAEEPLKLSDKDVARDFTYVEDIPPLLCEALEKVGRYKGEIFNLGTGKRTTIEELVRIVEQVTGNNTNVEWGAFPVQSYDSKLWQADMSKTFAAFSWRPQTELPEGIERLTRWLVAEKKSTRP